MKTAVQTEHAMAPQRAGDPKGQALLREAISASALGYGAAAHRLNAALVEHYLKSGYVLPAYRRVAATTIKALRGTRNKTRFFGPGEARAFVQRVIDGAGQPVSSAVLTDLASREIGVRDADALRRLRASLQATLWDMNRAGRIRQAGNDGAAILWGPV